MNSEYTIQKIRVKLYRIIWNFHRNVVTVKTCCIIGQWHQGGFSANNHYHLYIWLKYFVWSELTETYPTSLVYNIFIIYSDTLPMFDLLQNISRNLIYHLHCKKSWIMIIFEIQNYIQVTILNKPLQIWSSSTKVCGFHLFFLTAVW